MRRVFGEGGGRYFCGVLSGSVDDDGGSGGAEGVMGAELSFRRLGGGGLIARFMVVLEMRMGWDFETYRFVNHVIVAFIIKVGECGAVGGR